ncbi:hypothetical protein [Skermanella stibiiresistens]|uniref:hypothetical protein n=1 Tax=Skermanella stibiiresistens TaxID=913326 RepID=UPI0012F88125|nr:hypothetical protein [Skermanella stibiiresistens]
MALNLNPQSLGTGAGQWIAASGIMPGLSAAVNRLLYLVLMEHRMPYEFTDREIKDALQELSKEDTKTSGRVLGLAAVVALLPATAGVDPRDAKSLISELLRSSHGAGEVRREAEQFVEYILSAARDVATHQNHNAAQGGSPQASASSLPKGNSSAQP